LLTISIFVGPCIISNNYKEESELDATITVYWWIQFSSTCFRQQFCPSSGASDYAIQLVVCCTQYAACRWSGNVIVASSWLPSLPLLC